MLDTVLVELDRLFTSNINLFLRSYKRSWDGERNRKGEGKKAPIITVLLLRKLIYSGRTIYKIAWLVHNIFLPRSEQKVSLATTYKS